MSKEVLLRYEAERGKLQALRETARAGLSFQDFFSALEAKSEEGIALPEKLMSDLKAIEKRAPGTIASTLPRMVALWRKSLLEDKSTNRLSRVEALLEFAVFSTKRPLEFTEEARGDILGAIEAAVQGQRRAAVPLLVLLSGVGAPSDIPRLEAVAAKSPTAQLSYEISRVLETLRKRQVATR